MMPFVDGWQVIERLRQDDRLAGVPVVIITAFNRDLGSAAELPRLRKPIELGDLLSVTNSYGCVG
jgi:CheY-like chemotaxis protein